MARPKITYRRPVKFDETPVYQKGRPSGEDYVRSYINVTNTPEYKKATPQVKRKFRKENEAVAGFFKDVI